ncbi:hypothetical protein [Streptomyces sp. CAU 1734]|uniref:hypothetical protein n=1 Tax=Streptomyces sp. CAU 1734 TaxID=3140360 RepID=UPI003260D641
MRTALTRGAPGSVPAPLPAETPGTASAIAVAAAHGGCPGPLRVESAFGKPRLSLSRAIMEHPPAGIEPQLRTGGAGITVPRDAMVEPQGLVTGW